MDSFLRVLDEELAAVGATRGTGGADNVKSVARLVGHEEDLQQHGDEWITERVRDTCKLPDNNSTAHVLGVDIGSPAARDAQFRKTSLDVAEGRAKIASIGDSATEQVLTGRCADVCKITHLLRAHGQAVSEDALENFDSELNKALALASGGPLHQEALKQVGLGVKKTRTRGAQG